MIVIHGELTTGHLNHTVVDGFVSVKDGLVVGLLDGVQGTGSFVGFVSSTNIQKDTEVNNVGEGLGFSEDGDSVLQLSDFIIGRLVLSVLDLKVIQRLKGAVSCDLVIGAGKVLSIEDFKEGTLDV